MATAPMSPGRWKTASWQNANRKTNELLGYGQHVDEEGDVDTDSPDEDLIKVIKGIVDSFEKYDIHKDGYLDCKTFTRICVGLLPDDSERRIEQLVQSLDTAAGDRVCYERVIRWMFHAAGDAQCSYRDFMVHELEAAAEQALEKVRKKTADEKKMAWMQDYYTSVESIRHVLEQGSVVLLKGDWLVKMYSHMAVLPRRQDLPEEAWWKVEEKPWQHEHKRTCTWKVITTGPEEEGFVVDIVAISYCWHSAGNPDPKGQQLKEYIGPMLQHFLACKEYRGDFQFRSRAAAVFLDWCSMHQKPRTAEEQELFDSSLKDTNIWYGHANVTVWMLTKTYEGVKPFNQRGWPCFEKSVSTLIKNSAKALDLQVLHDGWVENTPLGIQSYNSIMEKCRPRRKPPMAPLSFARMLATKNFTNGCDQVFVAGKYSQTFCEVMMVATELNFNGLQWGDEDVMAVAESLHFCRNLQVLDLSKNNISDMTALCRSIVANNPELRHLNLESNFIASTDELVPVLATTLLNDLNLASNKINDIGNLGRSLSSNKSLKKLNLRSNKIEDITELAQSMAGNACLKTLNLNCNCITDISELGRNLALNGTLEDLSVTTNKLKDTKLFGLSMTSNTVLKRLEIFGNPNKDNNELKKNIGRKSLWLNH